MKAPLSSHYQSASNQLKNTNTDHRSTAGAAGPFYQRSSQQNKSQTMSATNAGQYPLNQLAPYTSLGSNSSSLGRNVPNFGDDARIISPSSKTNAPSRQSSQQAPNKLFSKEANHFTYGASQGRTPSHQSTYNQDNSRYGAQDARGSQNNQEGQQNIVKPRNNSQLNFSSGFEKQNKNSAQTEPSSQNNRQDQVHSKIEQRGESGYQRKLFQEPRYSVDQEASSRPFLQDTQQDKKNYRSNSSNAQAVMAQPTPQYQNFVLSRDHLEERKNSPLYEYQGGKRKNIDQQKPPNQNSHYSYKPAEKEKQTLPLSNLNHRKNQHQDQILSSRSTQPKAQNTQGSSNPAQAAMSGMIVSKDEYIQRTSEERKHVNAINTERQSNRRSKASPEKKKSSRYDKGQDVSSPTKDFDKISPIKNPKLAETQVQKQKSHRPATFKASQNQETLISPPGEGSHTRRQMQNLKTFNSGQEKSSRQPAPRHQQFYTDQDKLTAEQRHQKLSEKYDNLPVQQFQVKSFDIKQTETQCSFGPQASQEFQGLNNLHRSQNLQQLLSPTATSNPQGFAHFQPTRGLSTQINYQPPNTEQNNHTSKTKELLSPNDIISRPIDKNFSSNIAEKQRSKNLSSNLANFSLLPSSSTRENPNLTAQPQALKALFSNNHLRDIQNQHQQETLKQSGSSVGSTDNIIPRHFKPNKSSPSKIVKLKVSKKKANAISTDFQPGKNNLDNERKIEGSSEGFRHFKPTNIVADLPPNNFFQRYKFSMDHTLSSSQTPTNNNQNSTHKPLFHYQPFTSAANSRKQGELNFDYKSSGGHNVLTQSAEFKTNQSHLARKSINIQQYLHSQAQPSPSSHKKFELEADRDRLSDSSYLYKTQNLQQQFKPFHPSGTYNSLGNQNILISGAGNFSSSARKDIQKTPLSSSGKQETQFILTPKDFYHGAQKHQIQSRENSSMRDNISSLIIPDNNLNQHPLHVVLQSSNPDKHASRSLSKSNNTQGRDQASLNRTQFSITPQYSAQNPSFIHSQTTSNPYHLSRPHLSNQALATDSFIKSSQNLPFSSQPMSSSLVSQTDMELIIMGLHEKMQNLESKYLDLANYYKREMVKRGSNQNAPVHSSSSQSFFPHPISSQSEAQNFNLGQRNQSTERSVSPIRIDNYYYSPQPNQTSNALPSHVPHSREKDLISELFKDKQELEQALKNMLELQSLMQDKHSHLQSRLKSVEKEKQSILKEKASAKEFNQRRQEAAIFSDRAQNDKRELMDLLDTLQMQTNLAIEQIENNLLLLMSSGFQQLSEGDLIDNFANLKIDIEKAVDAIKLKLLRNDQSSRLSVNDLQTQNPTFAAPSQSALDIRPSSPLTDREKKRQLSQLQELELSNEENQQQHQRAIFDLQNNHNLSKLEVRKVQIAVSQLQKLTKELKQEITKQLQAEKSNVNSTRSGITIQDQRSAFTVQASVNANQKGQFDFRILDGINQHIQSIANNSQSLSLKQKEADSMIAQMQDSEVIAAANFKELKQRFEKIINQYSQIALNFQDSPVTGLNPRSHSQKRIQHQQNQQTYEALKQKLKTLKYQNADSQDQIALKSLDIQQLEGQNRQFLQRMSDLEHQLSTHMQLKSSTEEQNYSDSNLYPSSSAQKQQPLEGTHQSSQRIQQRLLFDYTGGEAKSQDNSSDMLSPSKYRDKGNGRDRSNLLERSEDSRASKQDEKADLIEKEFLKETIENLQSQLSTLTDENQGLVRQIRTLHRTINEKNEQIEKLGSELQGLGSLE